jgi:hypothetical protein
MGEARFTRSVAQVKRHPYFDSLCSVCALQVGQNFFSVSRFGSAPLRFAFDVR